MSAADSELRKIDWQRAVGTCQIGQALALILRRLNTVNERNDLQLYCQCGPDQSGGADYKANRRAHERPGRSGEPRRHFLIEPRALFDGPYFERLLRSPDHMGAANLTKKQRDALKILLRRFGNLVIFVPRRLSQS